MFRSGLRVELLHFIAKILGIRFHINGIGFGKPKNLEEYEG